MVYGEYFEVQQIIFIEGIFLIKFLFIKNLVVFYLPSNVAVNPSHFIDIKAYTWLC